MRPEKLSGYFVQSASGPLAEGTTVKWGFAEIPGELARQMGATRAVDATDTDLAFILKHFGVDRSRLAGDLARSMDRLKSGNARTPSLSPTLGCAA